MKIPDNYHRFLDLNKFHVFIDRIFFQQQIDIMHKNFDAAIDKLKIIQILLDQHIRDEEELLLPLYTKFVSPIPLGGAVEFYIREHKQIVRYISDFIDKISMWDGNTKNIDLEIVRLFDTYYKFKHLVEHHDTREDTFLYRYLDKMIEKKQKRDVLNLIVERQNRLLDQLNGI